MTRGMRVGPGLGMVVIRSPILDQIPILSSSAHGWNQITVLMWCYDRTGCRFPSLPGPDSVHMPFGSTEVLFQRKKGCCKDANPLGLRKNPNHHWARSGTQTNKQTKQNNHEKGQL